jgi:cytochrome c oxidase assembly protein subunit 15
VVACVLVAATLVLLSFGALVTTYEAAMAVPDWPATYGHNMFLFPAAEWLGGPWDLFLEHGHRLLGAAVGLITLLLAVCVWRWPVGTTVRWLALAAVVLVLMQGALGGARVLLDDTTIAKVHACTGPLFFAVATALAVLSRWPSEAPFPSREAAEAARPAHKLAGWLTAAVPVAAYCQLVAGAQLRHLDPATPPATFHLLVAVHVLVGLLVVGLSIAAWFATGRDPVRPAGRRPHGGAAHRWAAVVAALVLCQFLLGIGTWVARYGVPSALLGDTWRMTEPVVARSLTSAATITAHAVLGMAILGAGVALAILGGGGGPFAFVAEPRGGLGRRAVREGIV